VDEAFGRYMAEDPLPLAIAGIDRHQAFLREVSSHNSDVIATLAGNYDHLTAHDLGRLIWPVVSDGFTARRRQVLLDLDAATGQNRTASTLAEVWYQVRIGRGDVLVVEDGYHQSGRVNNLGLLDLSVENPQAPDVLDDAVDEVVTLALEKGGRVVFVENGELAAHDRIALILRY
jgi:hypothetical protein